MKRHFILPIFCIKTIFCLTKIAHESCTTERVILYSPVPLNLGARILEGRGSKKVQGHKKNLYVSGRDRATSHTLNISQSFVLEVQSSSYTSFTASPKFACATCIAGDKLTKKNKFYSIHIIIIRKLINKNFHINHV